MLSLNIGILILSFGIVLTIFANVGFAPWEVFHWGIAQTTGISLGRVNIIASLVIITIAILLGEKAGIGTFINIILIGVYIDLYIYLGFIPKMNSLLPGILMLISGLFLIALGTALYMAAGYGAGPRDSLMVALERKTGLAVGICRSIIELTVCFVGWLLGGLVGIGTVISIFASGLCVQIVFTLLRFDATKVKHETMDVTFKAIKKYFLEDKLKENLKDKVKEEV
ncbi:MAG: hypothetical protein GX958_08560 [Desulfitobacterium sp.]|nr:hypothetical protein [Desulfitobacterium sp.]